MCNFKNNEEIWKIRNIFENMSGNPDKKKNFLDVQGWHMVSQSQEIRKTKKNDISQVKMGVFGKSQEKFLKYIKFTKFIILKSLSLVKIQLKNILKCD